MSPAAGRLACCSELKAHMHFPAFNRTPVRPTTGLWLRFN